jgi:hypothetical protein
LKISIDINEVHTKLGHISIAEARNISRALSRKITGESLCEACAIGKAKRKKFVKK